MTDEKKVVKLTKVPAVVVEDDYPTYEELLARHLAALGDIRKKVKPVSMVVTCLTEDGNIQEILYGDCVAQVLGLLELTKQNIYLDAMGILDD